MRVVVFVNAVIMLFFAVLMGLCGVFFSDSAAVFEDAFVLVGALSLFLAIATNHPITAMSRSHTFLLTSSVWLSGTLAGAVPLLIWGMQPVDAVFEAMSALTTTGATVLSGLDDAPRGILFWRALLQGFGGIGFIVTGMALLPVLRTGGMQLFRTESSDTGDKELNTVARFASASLAVYLGLIVLCAVTYHIGGMSVFDAITHAMTTLSTGGFSNYDASFGHFASPFLHWAGTLFMALGAVPFVWYIRAAYRRKFASEQVVVMVQMLAAVILVLSLWLVLRSGRSFLDALTEVAFNVISIVTTTGYATENFLAWGPFAVALFFFLTAVGGCTGSTAGGAKMMRWIILGRAIATSIKRIRHPHGVFAIRYEGRPVSEDVLTGVISFFMFYFLTVAFLGAALSLSGLDFDTAISGALTAVANVGPGVGEVIGPAGNFAPLGGAQKMLLAFGMYAGRLEMLTVYVLFTRSFWREI